VWDFLTFLPRFLALAYLANSTFELVLSQVGIPSRAERIRSG